MEFIPNKSTADYLFEKAEQCFRRSPILLGESDLKY
jgi:hypothetical protein